MLSFHSWAMQTATHTHHHLLYTLIEIHNFWSTEKTVRIQRKMNEKKNIKYNDVDTQKSKEYREVKVFYTKTNKKNKMQKKITTTSTTTTTSTKRKLYVRIRMWNNFIHIFYVRFPLFFSSFFFSFWISLFFVAHRLVIK